MLFARPGPVNNPTSYLVPLVRPSEILFGFSVFGARTGAEELIIRTSERSDPINYIYVDANDVCLSRRTDPLI